MKGKKFPDGGRITLYKLELPAKHLAEMPNALREIKARGYEVSPFPYGDEVTFGRTPKTEFDPSVGAGDFRESFPCLNIGVFLDSFGYAEALSHLAGDLRQSCQEGAGGIGVMSVMSDAL